MGRADIIGGVIVMGLFQKDIVLKKFLYINYSLAS